MATYTPNLNLKKPSTGEYYDVVGDNNDAKDKIDNKIGTIDTEINSINGVVNQKAEKTTVDVISASVNQINLSLVQKAEQTALDVVDGRIDSLIATAGDGTIPSELTDIRVGEDAITYATAGAAVREQFNKVNTSLVDKVKKVQLLNIAPNQNFANISNVFVINANVPTVANNILTFITNNTYGQAYEKFIPIAGRKYYAGVKFKTGNLNAYFNAYNYVSNNIIDLKNHSGSNQFELIDFIFTAPTSEEIRLRVVEPRSGYGIDMKQMVLIDLTACYGAGNEPDYNSFKLLLSKLTGSIDFFENGNVKAFADILSVLSLVDNNPQSIPYYVHLENEVLTVIQKYSDINDIKFTWKKMYPNDIFNLATIHFIPNTDDIVSEFYDQGNLLLNVLTDTLGPFLVKAINNIDGDKPTASQFTGGSHGYNNNYIVDVSNTPTGKTEGLVFKIDGKNKTQFSGYCNSVDVYWKTKVQASNTIKASGLGREVLEEEYNLNFKNNQINVFNTIKFLEPVNILSYYGIQASIPSLFRNELFYHTSANRFWNSASVNSNSVDDECNIITCKNANNFMDLELDVNTGLGKMKLLNSVAYNALTASYGKTYFNLVENKNFATNEILSYRGTYRFYTR